MLIRLAGGIAHLVLRERSLTVLVAAADNTGAAAVRAAVAAALPEVETDDREVPVRFWWSRFSARELARMLPSPLSRPVEVGPPSAPVEIGPPVVERA